MRFPMSITRERARSLLPEQVRVAALGKKRTFQSLLPQELCSCPRWRRRISKSDRLFRLRQCFVQTNKVSGGILEDAEVPGTRNECRRENGGRTEFFSFFERSGHIVGRDVNHHRVRLEVEIGLADWHHRAACAALWLKHQVVHFWNIKLSPAKKIRIKLSCYCRVRGSDLNMSYNMVRHWFPFLSIQVACTCIKCMEQYYHYNMCQKRHIPFFFHLSLPMTADTGEASICYLCIRGCIFCVRIFLGLMFYYSRSYSGLFLLKYCYFWTIYLFYHVLEYATSSCTQVLLVSGFIKVALSVSLSHQEESGPALVLTRPIFPVAFIAIKIIC